jgi:hypothetical protein
MIDRNFILKSALLLTIATVAVSCSNGKVDMGTDLSSRSTGTVTPATSVGTPSTKGLLARCNQKSQGPLTANLAVYKDASGNVRDDYMNLKFTQIPGDFAGGSYFEFFRWRDKAGQPDLDSTPVQARIETLDGKVLTDFSNVIYWNQVYAIAAQSGTTDPATFFKYVRLVLNIRDVNAEYDVLKIAYYSPTSQLQINMDMLLPSFYVTPAEYANDKGSVRAGFLQALHPFANTLAMSSDQLKATSETYCF